ncbi:glycosyl hydrolase [Aquincola sp. S2]|uniref:Glycosyl hydrolase n=1 Tax=Pseudaquabacterium terrae TaxID=2732868 RepID=A0ABX2EEY8_9BURK|nr:YCF48-related protein [Aquabacterium terrae]NRF67202.1 glycosyl hydrolase [Aquabacterium terrae]
MKRRHFLGLPAAFAGAAAFGNPGRDVLDTPAQRSPLAERGLINGLARAGERLVAVGQRGHVLFSDDGGRHWQQAEVPASSDLIAVHFPTPRQGYACGHDGLVLGSSDSGRTWRRLLDGRQAGALMLAHYQRLADPRLDAAAKEAARFAAQGAENPWLDCWFADDETGFVVGAFGQILRTADGGASWQPWLHAADNPKGLHLYAVRGIGADVWIAGEQGLLLKLDRDAGRFKAIELPYKGTLFGVIGNPRGVLVHGLRGTVLRSTDGGRSWAAVPTGLQIGLPAATLDAQNRFVLVSQAGHVLASRDDGASFVPIAVERPLPAAAVAAAPGALVLAGPRGVRAITLP